MLRGGFAVRRRHVPGAMRVHMPAIHHPPHAERRASEGEDHEKKEIQARLHRSVDSGAS